MPEEVNKLLHTGIKKHKDKFIIRQPVTVQDKKYFNLHRLLRCIHKNLLLSKLPVEEQCSPDEIFLTPAELISAFKAYPFIVTNTYNSLKHAISKWILA